MRKSGAVAVVECGLKNGTISNPRDAHTGSNRNRNNPSNTNNNIGFRSVLPANTEEGTLANAHSCSRLAERKQKYPFGVGTVR